MQIAFCASHSFFVEVQVNAGYICTGHVWQQPVAGDCKNLGRPL